MKIRSYVKGIALVLLILSAVTIVIATQPTVKIETPSSNKYINKDFTFIATVISTNENLNSVYFNFTNTSSGDLVNSSGNLIAKPIITSDTGDNFTYKLNTLEYADGNYSFDVVAENNNSESDTATRSFRIDNTPPSDVTNISSTAGPTYINWTWNDPPESDFTAVSVWVDGKSKGQVSKGKEFYNATRLTPDTKHNISLYSLDAAGNKNAGVTDENTTLPLQNTPKGNDIEPTGLPSNVTIKFSSVTKEGLTTVSFKTTTDVPHSFELLGSYIAITTDAEFNDNVAITVRYPEPPEGYNESNVHLYHLKDGIWEDVTTALDTDHNDVTGDVTNLSDFAVGIDPPPGINVIEQPSSSNISVGDSLSFDISVDQAADVTWKIDGNPSSDPVHIQAEENSNFTFTPDAAKTYSITVDATNINGTKTKSWNITARSKTFFKGNRIWDGSKPDEFSLTYTWNPMSFYAFYYDLDSDVGSENLQIALHGRNDQNLDEDDIVYSTTPESVKFNYDSWGSYNVIGFMAEKYFAGYTSETKEITSTPVSTLNSKQLHRVLTDDDTKRAIYAGSTLTLSDGYVLKIKDVDITGGKIVLLSLLKDGGEVDSTAIEAGKTYTYTKRIGSVSDVPIIAAHIDTVFSGKEANAAFIRGIFQISENYTSVEVGNRYGIMEITDVSNGITMKNKNSLSLSPNSVNDVMGDIKLVVADNSSVLRFAPTVKKSGTYEVRGTISQNTDTSFEWNPLNFEGFYYDLNEDVGTEKLDLTRSGTTVGENNLVYTTTPQSVSFKYKDFGNYNVIGFMAEKYFAGYIEGSTNITNTDINTMDSKQLHKVLIDDDTQRAVYAGSTLTLNDGYVLKIKDVDITGGKIVLLSLLKDGSEVDTTAVEAGKTYTYIKKVGSVSDVPIIAAHIETVFSGREANAAFIKGIFQISENYTSVNQGDRFGIMEVSEVTNSKIQMKNPSSFTLSPASTIDVMGNIKFKVADSGDVRFYPYIMVNGNTISVNQLSIDVPANPTARDTITISVTAGGAPVEGAEIEFDNNVTGITNSTGKLDYILTRSGLHNITATKLGYEKATKTIQVAEYVENRLSIEVPAVIDQGIPVTMQVLSNGTAVAGANVTLDGQVIWATDGNGTLNYAFNVSGTHNIGASKDKYVSVVKEISIRTPFSEYKALDINITPDVALTDQNVLIRSNITNAGTKKDTLPVDLIINNTVVDNRSVTLDPGETKEINFTRNAGRLILPENETLPGNYTVEILGQKGLLQVKEEPLNYLLIGGIITGLGAIIIYVLTAKSKISLEAVRNYLNIEEIRRKLDMLIRTGKRGL